MSLWFWAMLLLVWLVLGTRIATFVCVVQIIFLLAACGSTQTLDQMRSEALVTGDWTKVERREAKLEREAAWASATAQCNAQGKILLCSTRGSTVVNIERECGCADRPISLF